MSGGSQEPTYSRATRRTREGWLCMLRTYAENHAFLGCDSCGSYKYIFHDPQAHLSLALP
jgi:hypothetical protein